MVSIRANGQLFFIYIIKIVIFLDTVSIVTSKYTKYICLIQVVCNTDTSVDFALFTAVTR